MAALLCRFFWAMFLFIFALALTSLPSQVFAAPTAREHVADLLPLWRANAPFCSGAPSSENCEDGDMTLFSGLLCASGDALGCASVKTAQGVDGRWYRSPRLQQHPDLKPSNSFSWDMALGVQLYAVTTGDKVALARWLQWVEASRPCLTESPVIDGKKYCLVRGWPRWCPDDDEKGCTARPQDLATLIVTVDKLGVQIPPPTETAVPGGTAGIILAPLISASREANAALSLEKLLPLARGLQPTIVLLDAAGNRPGYSRHLAGVDILLLRRLGAGNETVDRAAQVLVAHEADNPFFQFLAGKSAEDISTRLIAIAPDSVASMPHEKADWAWQRETSEQAWKKSNLWDFVFMANIVGSMP